MLLNMDLLAVAPTATPHMLAHLARCLQVHTVADPRWLLPQKWAALGQTPLAKSTSDEALHPDQVP